MSIMLKFIVAALLLLFLLCFAVGEEFTTIKKGTLSVDVDKLRNVQKTASDINVIRKLIKTLNNNPEDKTFEIVEVNDATEEEKLDLLRKGSTKIEANFITKSTFTLHASDNYLNLDAHEQGVLQFLNATHVKHCSDEATSFKIGHFIIGYDNAKEFLFNNDKIVARQVIDKISDEQSCTMLQTIPIHHFELFSHIRTESSGEIPFQTSHYLNNITEQNRRLDSKFVSPTSPIVACSSPRFEKGGMGLWSDDLIETYKQGYKTADVEVNYCLLCPKMCAQYSKDLPGSFNFNYDLSTGKAKTPSLEIIQGVNCKNCYMFFGAGFLVIAEFYSLTFMFELKMGGGAGFNAEIDVNNPSISGSKRIPLLGASSEAYSFPLGGGLSLSSSFGGLFVTLSGSGSATGSSSFGAGYSTSVQMGVMFNGYSLSFPGNFKTTQISPFIKDNNFQVQAMSVTAQLTAVQNFDLSYAGVISVNFASSLSGTVAYTYKSSNSVASKVSVSLSSSTRRLVDEIKSMEKYGPGDVFDIGFHYEGFPKDEEIVLFYSIAIKTFPEICIMQKEFITSSTGSGVLKAVWIMPWNSYFASANDNEVVINIRGSNQLSTVYSSHVFTMSIFTDTDGIFLTPVDGETVISNVPFAVTWIPDLLSTFETILGSTYHGNLVVAEYISFELVCEKLYSNGTIESSVVTRNMSELVPNTGSYNLTISDTIASSADRFYLNVVGDVYSNVRGWSPGYFFIKSQDSTSKSKDIKSIISANNKLNHLAHNILEHSTEYSTLSRESLLEKCTDQAQINFASFTEGSIVGVTILKLFRIPISASTGPFKLVDNVGSCIATNGEESPKDPTFNPTKKPSFTTRPSYKPTSKSDDDADDYSYYFDDAGDDYFDDDAGDDYYTDDFKFVNTDDIPMVTSIPIDPSLPVLLSLKPTTLSTRKPTQPSLAPTTAPIIVLAATDIYFGVRQTFEGLVYANYVRDKENCDNAIIATIVSSMTGVTMNAVLDYYVKQSDSRRRLASGQKGNYMEYNIYIQNPTTTYETLVSELTSYVQSGNFAKKLNSNAEANKAVALKSVTVSSVETTNQNSDDSKSKKKLSTGAIIGIVVGGILFLGLLAGILYFVMKSKEAATVRPSNNEP